MTDETKEPHFTARRYASGGICQDHRKDGQTMSFASYSDWFYGVPAEKTNTRRDIRYDFPLNHYLATLFLPRDLSLTEVKRLSAFLHTLICDVEEDRP